jgi:hypothetical protein
LVIGMDPTKLSKADLYYKEFNKLVYI